MSFRPLTFKLKALLALAALGLPASGHAATMDLPQFGAPVNGSTITTPNPDEITPEIASLAAGVVKMPSDDAAYLKCFAFVRDHIAYEHYYGCKRGAQLTLSERRGNDLDQATLLVALLRQAGYEARYGKGLRFRKAVSGATYTLGANSWGLDLSWGALFGASNLTDATNISRAAGFTVYTDPGLPGYLAMDCSWVQVKVDGNWIDLNPSVKSRVRTGAPVSLASASGYNRANLLSALRTGYTSGTNFVKNLNEAQLNTYLTGCASSLIGYIDANAHGKLPGELSGNSASSTPFWDNSEYLYTGGDTYSTTVPSALLSYMTLQVSTISSGAKVVNWRVPMANLQGRRLSLTFADTTGVTTAGKAKVWLDDTLVASETTAIPSGETTAKAKWVLAHPGGNSVYDGRDTDDDAIPDWWEALAQGQTGYSTTLSATANPDGDTLTNLHEYLYRRNPVVSDANGDGSKIGGTDMVNEGVYKRTGLYAIIYGFGNSSGVLAGRQARLAAYREAGFADNSWQVVTEGLNVIGQNWLCQTDLVSRLFNGVNNCESVLVHRVGRVAQENGLFIDVPGQTSNIWSVSGDAALSNRVFVANQLLWSAMEHAVIQQAQGDSPADAASTCSLLRLANNQNLPVYFGTSANWSTVRPLLLAYSAADLANLDAAVNSGGYALAPSRGDLKGTGWSWAGAGYFTKTVQSAGSYYKSGISGNLNGGYSARSIDFSNGGFLIDFSREVGASPGSCISSSGSFGNPGVRTITSGDPIDMNSGDFTITSTVDLSFGAPAPRGLSFARLYHGGRNELNPTGLGYGWTHNWQIRAVRRSAFEPVLGDGGSVYDLASSLVAVTAMADLLGQTDGAESLLGNALIADWLTDRLLKNAISVSIGEKNLQFVKRADGVWQPARGITSTMTPIGVDGANGWTLTERHGNTYTFSANGRLTTVTDLWGKAATVAYVSAAKDAKVASVTDAYGRSLTFAYDGTGNLTSVADGTRTVNYTYDENQNLVAVRDPEGKSDKYTYDTAHRMTEVRNPAGSLMAQNTYDSWGRVSQQISQGDGAKLWKYCFTPYFAVEINPYGSSQSYVYDDDKRCISTTVAVVAAGQPNQYLSSQTAYDGQNRVVATVTPMGKTSSATYSRFHNVLTSTDPAGKVTTNTYDSQQRLLTSTNPLGQVTSFTYNAQHLPLTATDALNRVTTNTYNTTGTLATTTDPAGKVTSFTYNVKDMPIGTTYPDGTSVSLVRNNYDDPTSVTDAKGNVTTSTYNNRREVLTVTAPGGLVTSKTYDDNRYVASVTDPKGNTTRFAYSISGKPLATTLPDGSVSRTEYDLCDRPVRSIDPMGRVSTTLYRSDGRVVSSSDALGRTVYVQQNDDDQVISATDPLGNTASTDYDIRGLPVTSTDPLNQVSTNAYDDLGRRTGFTNRRNNAYTFTYDALGRPLSTTTPEGRVTAQSYDTRGLLATATQPSGAQTTFLYDNAGRETSRTDGVGTVTRTYDANGNLLTVTEGAITTTRTYDALNRVTAYSNGRGDTLGYSYDANGNLTALTYEPGKTVTYAYDNRNRLTTVTDWAGRVTTFTYDRAGRMLTQTRPNGTRRTQAYDAAGQLVAVKETLVATGANLLTLGMSYDAAGRVVSKLENPAVAPWSVPPALLARTGAYGADNRMEAFTLGSTMPVVQSADGNMTSGPSPLNPVYGFTYTYDARNRLVSGYDESTATSYSSTPMNGYGYDPEGNRDLTTQYTEYYEGDTAYESKEARSLIDPNSGLPRVLRIDSKQNNYITRSTRYVYAGPVLLYQVNNSGVAQHHHYDHAGSTVAVSNEAGIVTGRAAYSTYGVIVGGSGQIFSTPFRWNGAYGVQTDESGLLHMRARYYNPVIGRFISQDPLGLAAGPNVYAYCDGDPVMRSDPSGLDYWSDAGWTASYYSYGFFMGVGNAANGAYNLVAHPVDTFNGAGNTIGTVIGRTIYDRSDFSKEISDSLINTFTTPEGAAKIGEAVGQAATAVAPSAYLKGLSPATKGKIGETLTKYRYLAQGNKLLNEQVSPGKIPGFKNGPRWDFEFENLISGERFFVEAKMFNSRMSSAQKAGIANGHSVDVARYTQGGITSLFGSSAIAGQARCNR